MGAMQLRIEKWVAGGWGLARTNGRTALVRGGLPGELVEARVTPRKNHLEGVVVEVLEGHSQRYPQALPPSADLPLEYSAQLPLKQQLVQDALTRIGKLSFELSPIQASPAALGYRTAAQYALHPLGGLAYRRPESRELVRLDHDPLMAPPLQRAFELLSNWPMSSLEEVVLRGSLYEDRVLVGLLGGKARYFQRLAQGLVQEGVAGVTWGEANERGRFRGQTRLLAGVGSLLEGYGPILASVAVDSFAQVNPQAASLLFAEAAQIAGQGHRAIEVYAGSGILGLHLCERFDEVIGIEINPQAIQRGKGDLERLGVGNVRLVRGDASSLGHHGKADLVLLDPPRTGLSEAALKALLAAQPERILYISCDPPTWARDLGILNQAGYSLRFARPYDFYPFTHHVEVLSLLERNP